MDPILKTIDLHKYYQKETVQVRALQGVSFSVQQGEYVSIVGRSGSGKSTLLNLIGGLDTATSGQIFIHNTELTRMRRQELVHHRRKTVGMVFQSFNLISSRTALENVILALVFGNVKQRNRKTRAAEILSIVGLEYRLHHKPGELSGGEAQRVAIARALANEPDVLLADEPTGNLDSRTSGEIIDLLRILNQEQDLTVLMVTHDELSAKSVSHRVIQLLDGKIVDQNTIRGIE